MVSYLGKGKTCNGSKEEAKIVLEKETQLVTIVSYQLTLFVQNDNIGKKKNITKKIDKILIF